MVTKTLAQLKFTFSEYILHIKKYNYCEMKCKVKSRLSIQYSVAKVVNLISVTLFHLIHCMI